MPYTKLEYVTVFFDQMPYFVWLKDEQGRYVTVNKPLQRFLQSDDIAVLGQKINALFSPDTALPYAELDAAVMKDQKTLLFEHLCTAQGKEQWLETYLAPIISEAGTVEGLLGMSRKIRKRKVLEKELRQQKIFYKTILDAIPDFIFYKDTDGVLLGCNQACVENFYGMPEKEIVGKTSPEIIPHSEVALLCLKKDMETFKAKRTVRYEERMKLLDESVIEVETEKTPFYDDKGVIAGLIGISRDITERKRLEQEVKESQERYAAIVNNAPQIVLIHKENNIQFINDAGVDVLGYTREELVGSQLYKLLTPVSVERVKAAQLAVHLGQQVGAYDVELVKKSGDIIHVLIKAAHITYEGEPAKLAVLIDMTERKLVEEKLKASEEKFRQLAENINEVFCIRDKERFIYISPAFERIFGISGQAVLEDPLYLKRFVHPLDFLHMQALFAYDGEHLNITNSAEFRIIRPDGEVRWCHLQTYPIQEQDGTVIKKAITIVDVTDRKRIGEELRERVELAEMELNLAARVQKETLPLPFENASLEIQSLFLPYNTVSGDMYNYKWFQGVKKLRGYVVDVSGHGVAMALQTSALKMLLDNELLHDGEINGETFRYINEKMLQYLHEECFAGLLYFEFDFATHLLTVTSGGINLFLAERREHCQLLEIDSCYLGMFEKADIETMCIPFTPGDVYCLMSDGVSDLIEQFGVVKQNNLDGYIKWLDELGQQPERSDDFSVVCVKIKRPVHKHILVIHNEQELQAAQRDLAELFQKELYDRGVMLEVAVNEALNNGLRAGNQVKVMIRKLPTKLLIRVKDDGAGFATDKIKEILKKELTASELEEEFDKLSLAESGRGILMMSMLCDKLVYNHKGNEVLLIKYLE